METAVENTEADGVALDLLVRGDHPLEVFEVVRRCLARRLANDFELDDAAALERIAEVALRQGQEEVQRREQCPGLQVGDIGAAAMACVDDAEHGQSAQSLAQA